MSGYDASANGHSYGADDGQQGAGGPPQAGAAPRRKGGRRYAAEQYDFNAQNPGMGQGTAQIPADPSQMFVPAGGAPFQQGPGQQYPGVGQPYGQPVAAAGYGDYGAGTGYAQQPSAAPMQQPQQPYGAGAGYGAAAPQSMMAGFPGQAQGINGATKQFSQMSIRALPQVESMDLMNTRPEISDLQAPPPTAILPDNLALTPSPHAATDPRFFRSTINACPTNSGLLKKSKLPLALIVRPFLELTGQDGVPIVTDTIIARCRRCRTYINPYVSFVENGYKWKCNLCGYLNETPSAFDFNQLEQKSADRFARVELNHSVCDFLAPQEYAVRPPTPPTYVFLIDVSFSAVTSGLVGTAARVILEALDQIPNEQSRAKVAFIAVDSSLHYFALGPDSTEARMLVVGDLEEAFLPSPSDLLVSLTDCRPAIENLLSRFNEMFATTQNGSSAMGPALKAAERMIAHQGGKIITLISTLPNLGEGKLTPREDAKLLGTASETKLLQPQNSWYKSFAVECSKTQVTVDMFLFASSYQDVASLSCLPRYTAGATHYYPGWNANNYNDVQRFGTEFTRHLSQEIALEAVLRVRASTGLRMNAFYGNFFNRSSDLCAFPTVPRDQSYVVEVAIDENIGTPFVYFQAAWLNSTHNGERRVRVLTMCMPTTQSLSEMYASADAPAITHYFAAKAAERCLSATLDNAREAVGARVNEIMDTYRKHLLNTNTGASVPLRICSNLRLLPLLSLSLLKHLSLRKSSQIPSDLRSQAINYISTLPLPQLITYLHPRFYSLTDMGPECGLPGDDGQIVMPPTLNLTAAQLQPYGLYLLDDGLIQFLYIGGQAVPQLCEDVFGVSDISQVRVGKMSLPEDLDNDFSIRVRAVIAKSRELEHGKIFFPHLYVVRPDADATLVRWFITSLVEDRGDSAASPSYAEYLQSLKGKLT
ncbi:COPII subunit [Savitreella phatthalungensis]